MSIGELKTVNLVIFMSDEHGARISGAYGDTKVYTPAMDELAKSGVTFTNAYCNSPLCIPSRASFATGQFVHKIRYWDNATPYDGKVPSWGHHLKLYERHVTCIGRMHFAGNGREGFDHQIMPVNMKGLGDILGLMREPSTISKSAYRRFSQVGQGDGYIDRDAARVNAAVNWIEENASKYEPWVLYVGTLAPHFPLIVPEKYYSIYADQELEEPIDPDPGDRLHPALKYLYRYFQFDKTTKEFREKGRKAYYGLVTFVDDQLKRVVDALGRAGFRDDTILIYTSDHGEMLGDHGLWWKCNMYESAVRVPLIISGPGLKRGHRVEQPVSIVDLFPTICELMEIPTTKGLPGKSLIPLAQGRRVEPEARVFSEYHAHGLLSGMFMIRQGDYKYIYYVGYRPQLFNLKDDPNELEDLYRIQEYRSVCEKLERELRHICDPISVDALAKADQNEKVNRIGVERAKELASIPGLAYDIDHMSSSESEI